MALPEVQINIQDPGLGIVPASAGKTQVKLGFCQAGAVNSILSAGTVQAARTAIGSGPMLDGVAQVLGVAGGPVLMVPLPPSTYGTVTGAFALTGAGSGTVTGSKGPQQVVAVKIILGGTPGTFTYQVKIGSGAYGPTITSTADPYSRKVDGQQFTNLVFGNVTYVANDVYTLNLDGTVTRTGTGPATALDGSTHSPVDAYEIWVKIVTSGALGAGAFQFSLDGGNNYSGTIQIPSGGKYVVPDTGIVLTFASTFTAGDLYKGTASGPTCTNAEVTTALQALLANPSEWGFVHVMVQPSNAANSASLATVVDAQMTAAQAAFRYVFGVVQCPNDEGDTAIKSAFVSFVSPRVGVCVANEDIVSPLTGRTDKRNHALSYTARLSAIKLSSHPGQIAANDNGGAVKNVRGITRTPTDASFRDESATPGLDEARFVTMRTIIGLPGFYITRGRMMASPGSDFSYVQNRRVMDRACTVARAALLVYLNSPVRIDPTTGYIDERDAQDIEAAVRAKLRATLLGDNPECSSVEVAVSRTDNLLSTSTLNVEISVVPFGYMESIVTNIGFKNPALTATA